MKNTPKILDVTVQNKFTITYSVNIFLTFFFDVLGCICSMAYVFAGILGAAAVTFPPQVCQQQKLN